MSAVTFPDELSDLPSLVDHAANALANARSSAEVLQAKELAGLAYDQAKRAGRLARAQKAHDDLLRTALEVQGDAAEIEHGAVARLAEEYAAAQERGEVAGQGGARNFKVPNGNVETTAADIGISRKDIHQGRMVRKAEKAQPGIVHRTIKELVERREEPTKAAIKRVVAEVAGRPTSSQAIAPKPGAPAPAIPDAAEMVRRFIAATDELAKIDFDALAAGAPLNMRANLQGRCRPYIERLTALDDALEARRT